MKAAHIMAVAVLIVGSGLALQAARAQQPGINRTDLQRHDLSAPGYEAIQARVEFEPGAAFEYTSGVPLPTPSGFMVGTYRMVTLDGECFDIEIPAFSLDSPHAKRTIN
jgi:ApaG protein